MAVTVFEHVLGVVHVARGALSRSQSRSENTGGTDRGAGLTQQVFVPASEEASPTSPGKMRLSQIE